MTTTARSPIDHRLDHRRRGREAADTPGSPVSLRTVGVHDIEPDDVGWLRLVEMCAEPNIFADPAVLHAALSTGDDDVELLVADAPARDGSGRRVWCGVFPVRADRIAGVRMPSVSLWSHRHGYVGTPLVRLDALDDTLAALIDHLADRTALIRLQDLPVGAAFHDAVTRVARHRELTTGVWHQSSRATFVRAEDAATFAQRSIPTRTRKELERLGRRLGERGELRIENLTGIEGLDEWLDRFLVLEAAGWKGRRRTALACDPTDRAFLDLVADRLAADGRLLRTAVWLDDRPVAMQLAFVDGTLGWAFKMAHDPWFEQFSPGAFLELRLGEHLHQAGVAWMDSCASADHPMIERIWDARTPYQSLWVATRPGAAPLAGLAPLLRAGKTAARGWTAGGAVSAGPGSRSSELRIDPRAIDPESAFPVGHQLAQHPLFDLERLSQLAARLPASAIEYNAGRGELVQDPTKTPDMVLTAAETIADLGRNESWMVLKTVETDPDYRELLDELLDEFVDRTGLACGDRRREAFVFLSSPDALTPYHIDPEHNLLLQIAGSKTFAVHHPADRRAVSASDLERFFDGGHRNLDHPPAPGATTLELTPGSGVYVPVAAAHHVRNGPDVSISFSATFRSPRSQATARTHRLNHRLRRAGLPVTPVGSKRLGPRLTNHLVRGAGQALDLSRRGRSASKGG